tara:strand:+ start:487 stop:738 length:252 start_codon:yes stop_codon:yes gene_type:complete
MKSNKNIDNLDGYKPIRSLLCNLIDKNLLPDTIQKTKEISMFKRLYASNGKNCTYLLALCKAIHTTNQLLYNKLLTTKVQNGK